MTAFRWKWERAFLDGSKLRPTAMAVGLAMATYANPDGTSIRPGSQLIADKMGLSRSAITKAMASLVDGGWLVRERPGSKGQATLYRLDVPSDRASLRTHQESSDRASLRSDRASLRPGSCVVSERSCVPTDSLPDQYTRSIPDQYQIRESATVVDGSSKAKPKARTEVRAITPDEGDFEMSVVKSEGEDWDAFVENAEATEAAKAEATEAAKAEATEAAKEWDVWTDHPEWGGWDIPFYEARDAAREAAKVTDAIG